MKKYFIKNLLPVPIKGNWLVIPKGDSYLKKNEVEKESKFIKELVEKNWIEIELQEVEEKQKKEPLTKGKV